MQNIPYKILMLENTANEMTNQFDDYYPGEEIPLIHDTKYLYHGIRKQKYLEKLENILKEQMILAGKYLPNYYSYIDNCNKGEYVSLLKKQRDNPVEYQTFIEENISLIISPTVNAIITKYIDYDTWEYITTNKIKLNNLYSYANGECLVKDFIPINYIKAIGIPYDNIYFQNKYISVDKLIDDIQKLLDKYKLNIPIVNTSRYNLTIEKPKVLTKSK